MRSFGGGSFIGPWINRVGAPGVRSSILYTCVRRQAAKANFFDEVGRDWDKAWQNGLTPWDSGVAAPPLANLLKSGSLKPPATGQRALVPGCGSGYDCVTLAQFGWRVLGVDVSEQAIVQARELLRSESAEIRDRVEYRAADFFELREEFGLVFDYTFLCALPPTMRTKWAQKMREIVSPKGAGLVTLMFPIEQWEEHELNMEDGPPYEVHFSLYKSLLVPLGFELALYRKCDDSIKPRVGREALGVWLNR